MSLGAAAGERVVEKRTGGANTADANLRRLPGVALLSVIWVAWIGISCLAYWRPGSLLSVEQALLPGFDGACATVESSDSDAAIECTSTSTSDVLLALKGGVLLAVAAVWLSSALLLALVACALKIRRWVVRRRLRRAQPAPACR